MCTRAINWVFLGDSLTEGVGSSRVSYVTELVELLREEASRDDLSVSVNEVRLRKVDPASFNPFVRVNLAGQLNVDKRETEHSLCLWNLACEGKTISSDFEWLPLLGSLSPELIIVFRGSLESIVRPAMLEDDTWPWWLPHTWRKYAAMDPRCYFSKTWWRKAKQVAVDRLKQRVRLRLMQDRPGVTLMRNEVFLVNYSCLLARLREMKARILVLGLLPVDGRCFPGSPENFQWVNSNLLKLADAAGVEFFNWGDQLEGGSLFYRDGFHPSQKGARALAGILRQHVVLSISLENV